MATIFLMGPSQLSKPEKVTSRPKAMLSGWGRYCSPVKTAGDSRGFPRWGTAGRGFERSKTAPGLKSALRHLFLQPGGGRLRQLGGVLEAELLFGLLTIVLNGLDAQVQFTGDLARALPAA